MSAGGSVAVADLELAKRFAKRLAEKYDSRLFRVVLFGSRARGDAREESNLDLFSSFSFVRTVKQEGVVVLSKSPGAERDATAG